MSLLALIAASAASVPPGGEMWGVGTTADPVYVPPGSLDRWRAAVRASGTSLASAALFGDSTVGWGQPEGADPLRRGPVALFLSEQAVLDGWTHGGDGVTAVGGGTADDRTAPLTMDYPPILTWDGVENDGGPLPHGLRINAVDESVVVQGTGTRIRVHYFNVGSVNSRFTVKVDDAMPITVTDTTTSGSTVFYRTLDIDGLTDGLHTVTVTTLNGVPPNYNTDPTVNVMFDFTRPDGVVFHRIGSKGARSSAGTTNRIDHALTSLAPDLVMGAWGVNDINVGEPSENVQANTEGFIDKAQAAGADVLLLLPHPPDSQHPTSSARIRQALKDAAIAKGVGWVDLGEAGALGPVSTWSAKGYYNTLHPGTVAHHDQAAYLWENALQVPPLL